MTLIAQRVALVFGISAPLFALCWGCGKSQTVEVQGADTSNAEAEAQRRALAVWQRTEQRLGEFDAVIRRAAAEHAASAGTKIRARKEGSPAFADDALGWGSKFRLVWAALPLTDKETQKAYLAERFNHHIITTDRLEAIMSEEIERFLHTTEQEDKVFLGWLENELSVQSPEFRERILPSGTPLSAALDRAVNNASQQSEVSGRISANAADIGLRGGAATAVIIRPIVARVLAAIATRLGVSGAILGTGAATTTVTLGLSVIVGIVIDQLVSWVLDTALDPKGKVIKELHSALDQLAGEFESNIRTELEQIGRKQHAARVTQIRSLLGVR